MSEEELRQRREKIQAMREHILNLIPHASRESANKSLDELSTVVAMTATDIAIKATSDTFVTKIKEAAEEGKVIASGKQS